MRQVVLQRGIFYPRPLRNVPDLVLASSWRVSAAACWPIIPTSVTWHFAGANICNTTPPSHGSYLQAFSSQCRLWLHCSPAAECHLALLTARHLADRDEVIISCHQYSQLHTMTTEISFPVIMNRMTIPQDNVLASVLTKYQPYVLLAECFTAPAPVPLCCSSSAHAWGPAHCLHCHDNTQSTML